MERRRKLTTGNMTGDTGNFAIFAGREYPSKCKNAKTQDSQSRERRTGPLFSLWFTPSGICGQAQVPGFIFHGRHVLRCG